MNNSNSFVPELGASSVDAADFLTNRSVFDAMPVQRVSSFAIATGGIFTDNGSSNFAGDLANLFDDARVYADGGLTINGASRFSGFISMLLKSPTECEWNGQ
jgi:hypothetical protein